jgi:ribosomal protein L11 methyltransferase
LGAGPVLGVDIDPNALIAAKDNATNNHIDLQLRHSAQPLNETFDIVVANILTNPLCVLAPLLIQRIAAGGRIALSGVLAAQAEQVITAYAPYLALKIGATRDAWVRLEGMRC